LTMTHQPTTERHEPSPPTVGIIDDCGTSDALDAFVGLPLLDVPASVDLGVGTFLLPGCFKRGQRSADVRVEQLVARHQGDEAEHAYNLVKPPGAPLPSGSSCVRRHRLTLEELCLQCIGYSGSDTQRCKPLLDEIRGAARYMAPLEVLRYALVELEAHLLDDRVFHE